MTPGIIETLEPSVLAFPQIDRQVLKKLDPQFITYFTKVLSKKKPTGQIPIEDIRANPSKYAQPWHYDSRHEPRVKDFEIISADGDNFPVRCYWPDPDKYGQGPYGVHINFHGGGFVFGDLTVDSRFCLTIRDHVGIVVVDVNYRHCPEIPYGKNIEDTWASLNWVRDSKDILNTNPDSITIDGISAGGFFSCILQHLARDHNIPLRLAVPAVPATTDCCSYTSPADSPFESFWGFSNAPMLNWARMSYFRQYTYPKDKESEIRAKYPDWWLAPLKAPDFSNLCDTFMITAECDPVQDEGEAYGPKLLAVGNKVTFRRHKGVPHPFMHMTEALEQARQYDRDVIQALRVAHSK